MLYELASLRDDVVEQAGGPVRYDEAALPDALGPVHKAVVLRREGLLAATKSSTLRNTVCAMCRWLLFTLRDVVVVVSSDAVIHVRGAVLECA